MDYWRLKLRKCRKVEWKETELQILSLTSYYVALPVLFILSKVVFSAAKTKQNNQNPKTKSKQQQQQKNSKPKNPVGLRWGARKRNWHSTETHTRTSTGSACFRVVLTDQPGPPRSLDHKARGAGSHKWCPQCPTSRAPPGGPAAALAQRARLLQRRPSSPSRGSNAAVAVGARLGGAARGASRGQGRGADVPVLRSAGSHNTGWHEMGSGGEADTDSACPGRVSTALRRRVWAAPAFPGCLGRDLAIKQIPSSPL